MANNMGKCGLQLNKLRGQYKSIAMLTLLACNVTSTLSIVGSGVETCAITVAASQKLYITVSQTTSATALETYTLKVAE